MRLSHGQEKVSMCVKHVSGQGAIYIRALEDVFDDNVSVGSMKSSHILMNMSLLNGNCKNHELLIRVPIVKRKVTVTKTRKVFKEMSHSHHSCHQELVKVPGLILFKHDCEKCCWLFISVF